MKPTLALVGDFRESVVAHRAIPSALRLAAEAAGVDIGWEWIRTDAIAPTAEGPRIRADGRSLESLAGVWAVPASPYASMDGALAAIRFARETGRPFLGTCGGFQHALIEFARNVCGVPAADHAETNPGAAELVVTQLSCSLVEVTREIRFTPGSRLHAIFGGRTAREGYHCSYGPNATWQERLGTRGLKFSGFDDSGEVRAGELEGHPFFVGTLFQPERSALRGGPHPLITAFVRAVAAGAP
jgi:CTP synthase (UTP-ammonia lyase)